MSSRLIGFNNIVHVKKKIIADPSTKCSMLSVKDGILETHARTDYC